ATWRAGPSCECRQRDRPQHQDGERKGAPATPRVMVRAPQEPGFCGFTARTDLQGGRHAGFSGVWLLLGTGWGCKLAKPPEWVREPRVNSGCHAPDADAEERPMHGRQWSGCRFGRAWVRCSTLRD